MNLSVVLIMAATVFRRGLRGKLGFLAVVAPVVVVGLAFIFDRFSQGPALQLRLVLETGLIIAAMLVLGTALLLSSKPLSQGDDTRSMQALLTLPVSRRSVYLGYFFGNCLTLLAYTLGMGLALGAVAAWKFDVYRQALALHFLTLFVEAILLSAVACLLALSGSNIIAFFGTFAVGVVAHTESVIHHMAKDTPVLFNLVVWGALKFMPALNGLDIKVAAVRGLRVPWETLGPALLHSCFYLVAILTLASALFERSEL